MGYGHTRPCHACVTHSNCGFRASSKGGPPRCTRASFIVESTPTVAAEVPIVLLPPPAALPAPLQRVLRPSPFQQVPRTQSPRAPLSPAQVRPVPLQRVVRTPNAASSPPEVQPAPPSATSSQPLYDWSLVQHRALKGRERWYLLKADKLYSDTAWAAAHHSYLSQPRMCLWTWVQDTLLQILQYHRPLSYTVQ
jgi:hypothetical protein